MLVAASGIPVAMIKTTNIFKFIDSEYLYVSENGRSSGYKS